MSKGEQFQEQADILRNLAASFDIASIREELLALAEKCEALAKDTAEGSAAKPHVRPRSAQSRP
jgi:hypothetical protein